MFAAKPTVYNNTWKFHGQFQGSIGLDPQEPTQSQHSTAVIIVVVVTYICKGMQAWLQLSGEVESATITWQCPAKSGQVSANRMISYKAYWVQCTHINAHTCTKHLCTSQDLVLLECIRKANSIYELATSRLCIVIRYQPCLTWDRLLLAWSGAGRSTAWTCMSLLGACTWAHRCDACLRPQQRQ